MTNFFGTLPITKKTGTCPKCGGDSGNALKHHVTGYMCNRCECEYMELSPGPLAAGPWQDGEPPKDGEWYLGCWPDSESFGVSPFQWVGEGWYDLYGAWTSPPAFYAKINLPSAE